VVAGALMGAGFIDFDATVAAVEPLSKEE